MPAARVALAIAVAVAALTLSPPAFTAAGAGFGDVSFSSASDGWALVTAPCASGAKRCTAVKGTTDGGRTWKLLTPIAAGADAGISQLSAQNGVVSGQASYLTGNGGRTWARAPGFKIESATAVGGSLYALTYSHTGCPAECNVALRRARLGTSAFARVKSFPNLSEGFGESLLGAGRNLYAVSFGHAAGGAGTAYSRLAISRDAGATWHVRGDPCRVRGHEIDAAQVVAAANYVAALCIVRANGAASIVLSVNAGRTFAPLQQPIARGNEIAIDASGDLAIANSGAGTARNQIAVSTNRGATWRISEHSGTPSATGLPRVLEIFGRSLRWAISSQTLLRSDNGGLTWQATTAS